MAYPSTWNELAIKWTDRLIWIVLLCLLGWAAHQAYYDYLVNGLIKAGKTKAQIKELLE